MDTLEQTLSIADAAARTGLSTHTLRYYERAGLMLAPVDRASSSHRRYTARDLEWLDFLTKLRSTDMPVARVREYVDLVRAGDATMPERLELLLRHRLAVQAELEQVQRALAGIDKKIALYTESTSNT